MQWDDKFCWGDYLLGVGNLTRSDFDYSENCYLVGGMNLWDLVGDEFGGGGGVYWGVFFLAGGDEQIFS